MMYCGSNVLVMMFVLCDVDGLVVVVMGDEMRKLGYYGASDGMELYVVDNDL